MSATYEAWVGREEVRTERLAAWPVQALAATLGLDAAPVAGEPLPPGWHWIFFNPVVARGGLGGYRAESLAPAACGFGGSGPVPHAF